MEITPFVSMVDLKLESAIQKDESLEFIRTNFNRYSQRKIAQMLGLGKTTVNRWSKEIGLFFRKHTVNEGFFAELNETSSYLLGYIYADGNIGWNPEKGYQSLTITASAKDKDHLENLRDLLSSTKPLLYAQKTNSYRLIVNSKKLCLRLMQLGVTPKKSLTVKFPENMPEKNLRHFLRGVIDGDGTVRYCNRKKSPYFSIQISSGSEIFLLQLANSVKQAISVEGNVRKINQNLFMVEYTCSRGKKLANYIYSNARIFLKRKYLPYQQNVLEVRKND